jgi:DNA-binding MarR family transcriptional regulator
MEKALYEKLMRAKNINIDEVPLDEIERWYGLLNNEMLKIYSFVLSYNDYINAGHSYDSKESLSMLEAHILTDICDNENLTVTSLSTEWNRSKSATSQTVRKLMAKGLVNRVESEVNGKIFHLFPTEKGRKMSEAHKRYDVLDTIKTFKTLSHELTYDELQKFLKGLTVYTKLLRK